MKLFLIACAVIAVSQALSPGELVKQEWHAFKLQHGKKYSHAAEEHLRMQIFMENKQMIAEHNAKYAKGEVTFTMGMNEFGDLRHHEFVRMVNGYNSTLGEQMRKLGTPYVNSGNVKAPASIDWRQTAAVSEVKNQGQCGSCWSFSATGAIEGQHYRATGEPSSLSEQNLMDCSTRYGNQGCNGGVMQYAFQYVIDNRGIDTEKSYPYEARQGNCRYNAAYSGATISSFVNIQSGNENQLTEAVGTAGPVAVAMDASLQSFQFYNGGIYYDQQCSSSRLDHGVLAVGYGNQGGYDYWIVKNSWGTSWGDAGFFYIYRNMGNLCGLATQASYPRV